MSTAAPIDGGFYDPVETLPRSELRRLQERRLKKLLPLVYERSALIREKWQAAGVSPVDIETIDDFVARAPFIEKDDLRRFRDTHDDPFGGILCIDPAEISFIGSTSGTTGDPTLFVTRWGGRDMLDRIAPGLDPDGPSPLYGTTGRDLWAMGVRPGDYVAMMWIRFRGPLFNIIQDMGAVPILVGFGKDDIAHLIEISRRYRPKVLFTASNPLLLGLLQAEKELGVEMREVFSSYTGVYFAGEPIGPRARKIFERWGVGDRLYDQTSFGDLGHANQCRMHDGNHAYEDYGLVEVIDPETSRPLPEGGTGELVVTTLINYVDPLIRFRTGDLVRLTYEPCGCGRTHSRFWPKGRLGDGVVVNGRTFLPLDLWAAIENVEETSSGLFQIVRPQREMDELVLRVGYAGEPDLESLAARVGNSVKAEVGLRPRIELVPNEELLKQGPPHKIPRMTKQ